MRRWAALSSLALVSSAPFAAAAPRVHTLDETVHVRPGITCLDEATLHQQIRAWATPRRGVRR